MKPFILLITFLCCLNSSYGQPANLNKDAFCVAVKDYVSSLTTNDLKNKLGKLNEDKSSKGWGKYYNTKDVFPGSLQSEISTSDVVGASLFAVMAKESESLSYEKMYNDYFLWIAGMLGACLTSDGFKGESDTAPYYETAFCFKKKMATTSGEESVFKKDYLVVRLYIMKSNNKNRELVLSISSK